MSDTTQGQDAPQNDGALFREATSDLEKFENPELPVPPVNDRPADKTTQTQQTTEQQPDAAVPSGRFREESEARRRAEREAQDLRARLAAYEVQPRQQPAPQKQPDVLDNPQAFVESVMMPYLQRMEQREQMRVENSSADTAVRVYGEPSVSAARAALEQGMARQDPNAWATYNRAMASHDPYGVITRWHLDRATLQEIGGDLEGYKTKLLEEAMKNPEFQKKVIAAARGSAQAAGSQINRPAITQPQVPTLPSLSDIGAAGADEGFMNEPSDEALFRAAVSAKRRR